MFESSLKNVNPEIQRKGSFEEKGIYGKLYKYLIFKIDKY